MCCADGIIIKILKRGQRTVPFLGLEKGKRGNRHLSPERNDSRYMEKLRFSDEVFEKGAGRIYELLVRISMPALVVGVLVIAVINEAF